MDSVNSLKTPPVSAGLADSFSNEHNQDVNGGFKARREDNCNIITFNNSGY